MAKDPTSKRRRGVQLLNDRLLALKNLVRTRNEEITMEYSREYDEPEEEELPILHAEPAEGDTEAGFRKEPSLIDLDDLPVLTESVSAAPVTMPMDNDQPIDETPVEKARNTDTIRTELEHSANEILELIGAQISYVNLPHANSADHEALKRAIADHLEKHQIDS
jgi:hypothetical protein